MVIVNAMTWADNFAPCYGRVKPEVLRCLRSSITRVNQLNRAKPLTEPKPSSRIDSAERGDPLPFVTCASPKDLIF